MCSDNCTCEVKCADCACKKDHIDIAEGVLLFIGVAACIAALIVGLAGGF